MTISFDRLAGDYDATRGLLPGMASTQITDCILRLSRATADTQFLEPGIGTGRIALPLVQRGYSYTGIDISAQMLAECRRKMQDILHRLTLIRADVTSLPCAAATFDVVLTSGLLYYIPQWHQALAEIRRVLKPRGLYLYCYEETQRNLLAEALDKQWQAILTNIGFAPTWGTNFTDEDALKELQAQGATLEKVIAASWHYQQTLNEYLDTYPIRVKPLYQYIPDTLFSYAIQSFTTWASNSYTSEDTIISSSIHFVIQAVRFPVSNDFRDQSTPR